MSELSAAMIGRVVVAVADLRSADAELDVVAFTMDDGTRVEITPFGEHNYFRDGLQVQISPTDSGMTRPRVLRVVQGRPAAFCCDDMLEACGRGDIGPARGAPPAVVEISPWTEGIVAGTATQPVRFCPFCAAPVMVDVREEAAG